MNNNRFLVFAERLTGYVSGFVSVTCLGLAAGVFLLDTNLETQKQKIGFAALLLILGILSLCFSHALFKDASKSRD